MNSSSVYFKDIDTSKISGKTIILDIDGTITADGQSTLLPEVITQVEKLKLQNKIYLCSNKKIDVRNHSVAHVLNIPFIDSPLKKPRPEIIASLPTEEKNNILVIGDKFLTDGLFAKNVRGEFLKVKRLRSHHESFFIRLSYIIDNIASIFLG